MICYKDMTFCVAVECRTTECFRHPTHTKSNAEARNPLPLAMGDFRKTCGKYDPIMEDQHGRR